MIYLLTITRVGCAYTDQGCSAVVDAFGLDEHEQSCQFKPTECRFALCNSIVPKKKLDKHMARCRFGTSVFWTMWKPTCRIDPPLKPGSLAGKRKWLNAPSAVADLLIIPDNKTAVICLNGEVLVSWLPFSFLSFFTNSIKSIQCDQQCLCFFFCVFFPPLLDDDDDGLDY